MGGAVINPIIYAELSVWYDDIDVFETVVNDFELIFRQLPRDALFLAGKAFRQYRARRGARSGVLPDFFIGAHAAVSEYPVLTRDTHRIRGYFPTVASLAPEQT